jgi:hypothetical protein
MPCQAVSRVHARLPRFGAGEFPAVHRNIGRLLYFGLRAQIVTSFRAPNCTVLMHAAPGNPNNRCLLPGSSWRSATTTPVRRCSRWPDAGGRPPQRALRLPRTTRPRRNSKQPGGPVTGGARVMASAGHGRQERSVAGLGSIGAGSSVQNQRVTGKAVPRFTGTEDLPYSNL